MTRRTTPHRPDQALADDEEVSAWAASGAMALTGQSGQAPLGPPRGLVPKLRAVTERLRSRAAELGDPVDVDGLTLLGERAAIAGLERRGAQSCGGTTRLLPAGPDWLAVTLARPDDLDLVPAWLEREPVDDPWSEVATALATRPTGPLVERALLLGLPVGALPRPPAPPVTHPAAAGRAVRRDRVPGATAALGPLAEVVVIDLSSLWAGPLCGSLLAAAGATVIKVESVTRPDGARGGPPPFFDLLNSGKRGVALDLRRAEGVAVLRELLERSDVVIEASRPRALEHLGIDPLTLLASKTPRVWASITGHGRTGAGRDRVAFGDDAAVAGGLVVWTADQPCFCADAVADPTTGLVAAAAILDALAEGGRWLLDISMTEVAAHLSGPTVPVTAGAGMVAVPRARKAAGRGPELGEHTAGVLDDLRRRPAIV